MVALITFQLLLNAWAFNVVYSHESFISLILGGKLLHTSFLCLHHCCTVAASCCTQRKSTLIVHTYCVTGSHHMTDNIQGKIWMQ